MQASAFRRARRIVVKLGTSTVCKGNGEPDREGLGRIVREIAALTAAGRELIVVTSGAIGAGVARLGLVQRPRSVSGQQAAAAVGQGLLMQVYEELFSAHGLIVAQVLLTREDLQDRKRYLNCRNTFLQLLDYRVVPVVNENDTVAVDEIRFGDNDTLSALVASTVDADLLVILSDVDGVYTGDPQTDPRARRLDVINDITPELWEAAKGPGSSWGTGGMVTKLEAARIAMASGIAMVVAHGGTDGVLSMIVEGRVPGSVFLPKERLAGRKRWLAFHQRPRGAVRVDDGASAALAHGGSSLLPIGVIGVEGTFQQGDLVRVIDRQGREIARGLVNYGSGEIRRIQGLRTADIERSLGMKGYDEVIHRDNLVITV